MQQRKMGYNLDGHEKGDEPQVAGTPEDVAALYSWANLFGAKYRDFSASRREYREQIRYLAAQALRERELKAKVAEDVALAARSRSPSDSQMVRLQELPNAGTAARKASAERAERSRRTGARDNAETLAQREGREIANSYRPPSDGPEVSRSTFNLTAELSPIWRPERYGPDDSSGVGKTHLPEEKACIPETDVPLHRDLDEPLSFAEAELKLKEASVPPASSLSNDTPFDPDLGRPTMAAALDRVASAERLLGLQSLRTEPACEPFSGSDEERAGPAWLYAPQIPPRARVGKALSQSYVRDTLQDSRERVAARWFALKGVFGQAASELPAMQPARVGDPHTPLLLVFSLAGGVGKTSLVATLGRSLSSLGEKVVLTDTTSHGLLPFYFGARELRPGVLSNFSPSAGSTNASIYLVSYDIEGKASDERQQAALTEEIFRNAYGNNRVLLDLSTAASWLIRRTANLHPTVLVPVTPDMNSVISLQAVEKFFQGIVDSNGRALLPFYMLSQFDATLPLHLDVREVLRRQLGDRLLKFVIRRSPAVSEALAEGMTVVDYAPDAAVSKDYLAIAGWLRSVSPASAVGIRSVRWSER